MLRHNTNHMPLRSKLTNKVTNNYQQGAIRRISERLKLTLLWILETNMSCLENLMLAHHHLQIRILHINHIFQSNSIVSINHTLITYSYIWHELINFLYSITVECSSPHVILLDKTARRLSRDMSHRVPQDVLCLRMSPNFTVHNIIT
jgi:hypothetical protein